MKDKVMNTLSFLFKRCMKMNTIEQTVNEIFDLFKNYGKADYIGEPVSQLQHALQAAMQAETEGYGNEVILAALFHDIGHLVALSKGGFESMNGFGAMSHETLGSEYLLSMGFSNRMAELVNAHVIAKRYLVSKDENYFNQLSEASVATLKFQGGKMNEEEMIAFEANADFNLYLKMRSWDDKAKLENFEEKQVEYYKEMCLDYLIQKAQQI
jgi:2-amino-1-hydroxyethylphosphonate dioxygenase (glycine-forming)